MFKIAPNVKIKLINSGSKKGLNNFPTPFNSGHGMDIFQFSKGILNKAKKFSS